MKDTVSWKVKISIEEIFWEPVLQQQPGRIILHITNLTSAATWRKPIDELIPIGPLTVNV